MMSSTLLANSYEHEEEEEVKWSRSVVSDSLRSHGL